ncbi:MAG TPA: hypothetical protein VFB55_06190 [Verrucomicrobiae bacterium]|nr:hypothetical protein [Verrucomicrobiae bacterium]
MLSAFTKYGIYYAIIKDERYPTLHWSSVKTFRICQSTNLLEFYSSPRPPVISNFCKASTLTSPPIGRVWFLLLQTAARVAYGLSVTATLDVFRFQATGNYRLDWYKFHVLPQVSYGTMLPIPRKEYDTLEAAFDNSHPWNKVGNMSGAKRRIG